MNSFGIKLTLCVWLVIIAFTCSSVLAEYPKTDNWIEPDVWSRKSHDNSHYATNGECAPCNECPVEQKASPAAAAVIESNVTMLYFKRLIRLVFNRKHMNYDSFSKRYKLDIRLFITSHQLEELEKADNPRALDGLVTEIFKNVFTSHCYGNIEYEATSLTAWFFKSWQNMWKVIDTFEIRFILIFIFIMTSVGILSRRWGISYMALGIMLLFLFGFLHTYLECNRELKVNEVLDDLKEREERKWTFFGYIKSWFVDSDNELARTIHKLKKSAKVNLGFCRPDDVFLIYMNDVLLKYVRSLMHECTSSISNLIKTLPFPYNIIVAPMLIGFLVYLLKLIFKYILSPFAWCTYANSYVNSCCHKVSPSIKGHVCNGQEDKLSGDNLQLLLKAVNCINANCSGVEDVTDIKDVTKLVRNYQEKLRYLVKEIDQLPSPTPSITLGSSSKPIIDDNTKLCDNKNETVDVVHTSKVTIEDAIEN